MGPSGSRRSLAVVELGSTGIRMVVASVGSDGDWSLLDRAGKPVNLGRDVFTAGSISRETSAQCIEILKGFRSVLEGWGLSLDETVCMATSALREATNRDTFIDRVGLQTGFRIHTVEGIEEIRLMHLALQYALRDIKSELSRSNMMVLEVGGGSTEIMLLRRNRVALAHSLRVGTVRIQEQVRSGARGEEYLSRYLGEIIETTCDRLSAEVKLDLVKHLVSIGSDVRIAAERVGKRACDTYCTIGRRKFTDFVDQIRDWSADELVQRFRIPYSDAEGMVPGLNIVRLFLEKTGADEIIVPDVSIREGMLISLASGPGAEVEELREQIIASAVALGRKYHFDEPHGLLVSRLALRIFDAITGDHGLGPHERLLLEVAGILHDIGAFIKTSGHHKHSEYIVANSEIFGLIADDQAIVANLVRYHRKQTPIDTHPNFTALPPAARMVVVKLSAILRVADALDRGHNQRMAGLAVERTEGCLALKCGKPMDLSLERLSLEEKGAMFEDVFGLKVTLI